MAVANSESGADGADGRYPYDQLTSHGAAPPLQLERHSADRARSGVPKPNPHQLTNDSRQPTASSSAGSVESAGSTNSQPTGTSFQPSISLETKFGRILLFNYLTKYDLT